MVELLLTNLTQVARSMQRQGGCRGKEGAGARGCRGKGVQEQGECGSKGGAEVRRVHQLLMS